MPPILPLLLPVSASAVFLAAAVTDIRARRIANGLVLALAVIAGLRMAVEGGPSLADLGVALALFAAGVLAFHAGVMGGGDVKLLAVGALWTGAAGAGPFLVATALAGGALALGFLIVRPKDAAGRPMSLPYGVAIAAGGILATAGVV